MNDPKGTRKSAPAIDESGSAGGSILSSVTNFYGRGLISSATSVGQFFYEFDAIGSTADTTSASGSILDRYAYEPFGSTLAATSGTNNPIEFVGQLSVQSGSDGVSLMRARYYSAPLGRFISVDPLGLQGKDVNYYRYAANDPIDASDPHGLSIGTDVAGVWVDAHSFGATVRIDQLRAAHEGGVTKLGGINNGLAAVGAAVDIYAAYEDGPSVSTVIPIILDAAQGAVLLATKYSWMSTTSWAGPLVTAGQLGWGVGNTLRDLLTHDGVSETDEVIFGYLDWFSSHIGIPGLPLINPQNSSTTNTVDPNGVAGPSGYGPSNFISGSTALPYRVNFENIGPGSMDANGNPFSRYAATGVGPMGDGNRPASVDRRLEHLPPR